MGIGYTFTCSKCKKRYSASWGSGFMFPAVYEETMKAVRAGEYGIEWQKLVAENDYAVIDAEKYIYLCRRCHNWQSEPGLSIYEPKDIEAIKIKYKLDCDDELKDRPYVTTMDIKEEYRILKRYVHVCNKCSGIMHRATKDELEYLPCPECGGAPEEPGSSGMILWD